MASLDSAKGPSATANSLFFETILPSLANGWADLIFSSLTNLSYQAIHLLITFWICSGDRFLSQRVPRNNSIYCDVAACVFMVSLSLRFTVRATDCWISQPTIL